MKTEDKQRLKAMVQDILDNPFAWPGGYEKCLVLADSGLLCAECVKRQKSNVMADIDDGYSAGWLPAAVCLCTGADGEEQEWDSFCDHCGRNVGELFQ